MGNIVGEQIPSYTANQINKRQEIHGKTSGRTPQELTVLNSNTSWVKLASGVSVNKDKLKELELNEDLSGMTLARENILFGGTSSKPVQTSSTNSPVSSPKKYSKSPVAGYEHTEDFGIVPMPGIESISIKNLNRGSIKKAKIKIKVHSRSQFEIIDTLYLRLGYTALLEWGNANYISNKGKFKTVRTTLVEDPKRFFNIDFEKDRSWRDILPSINYYRDKYDGNYDGFLGKISNFSWDFNPDGSYDIDLEMISMGDIIESLKSNVSISPIFKTFIENYAAEREDEEDQEGFITPYDNSNLITSLLFLWKYRNKEITGPNPGASVTVTPGNGIKGYVGRKLYPQTVIGSGGIFQYYVKFKETTRVFSTVGSVSAGNFNIIETDSVNTIIGTLDGENTTRRFPPPLAEGIEISETVYELRKSQTSTITDEELVKEEILDIVDFMSPTNIPSTPVIRLNTKPDPAHYIRFKYLLQFIKDRIVPSIKSPGGVNTPLFRIDDTIGVGDIEVGNYMFTLPNQVSLDPRVCIVRNDSVYKVRTPNTPAKFLPELPPFRLVDDKPSTPHQNHAYLMNVYLNFDFVVSSLDSSTDDRGDVGLFGFINSLCEGINKAMGGINNLEPVIDESTNILKIIDSSLSKSKKRGAYGLEVVGYNPDFNSSTFLRNINLKTAITPEYATMMTIGATAGGYVKGVEATAFSNWNKGLIDRFKTEVTLTDNTSTSTSSTGSSDGDEAEQNYIDYLKQYVSCYGITPTIGWKNGRVYFKFVDDVIGNNISIVTEYYKFLQNKNDKGNTIGFIPFKFSFDMDGISGFKIYNQLHVSTRFLPRNYGNTLDFIVTGVTNNVKSNDWTTSIETMVIPVTRDTKGVEKNITKLSEGVLNYTSPAGGSGGSGGSGGRGYTPGSTYSPPTYKPVAGGWSWTQPGTSALNISRGPVLQGYDLAPHHDSSPSLYLTDSNQKFGIWTRRVWKNATHPGKLMIVGDASATRVENGQETQYPWIPSPVSGIVTFAGLYSPGSNGQQVSAIHIKSSATGHSYRFLHGSDIQFNTNDTIKAGDYMYRQSDKGSAGAIHVHYEFPDDKVWLINEWIRKMITNDPSYNHSTPPP